MSDQHVMPTDDTVAHTASEDCVCGPTPQSVEGGWVYTHHSLDNREAKEPTMPDPFDTSELDAAAAAVDLGQRPPNTEEKYLGDLRDLADRWLRGDDLSDVMHWVDERDALHLRRFGIALAANMDLWLTPDDPEPEPPGVDNREAG